VNRSDKTSLFLYTVPENHHAVAELRVDGGEPRISLYDLVASPDKLPQGRTTLAADNSLLADWKDVKPQTKACPRQSSLDTDCGVLPFCIASLTSLFLIRRAFFRVKILISKP
jgi:hypothetical protein